MPDTVIYLLDGMQSRTQDRCCMVGVADGVCRWLGWWHDRYKGACDFCALLLGCFLGCALSVRYPLESSLILLAGPLRVYRISI